MFVLKNRHASQLSRANCHAKLGHSKQLLLLLLLLLKTVAVKHSTSDVSTILFTNKNIYSAYTKNHEESPTVRICGNQKKTSRQNAR